MTDLDPELVRKALEENPSASMVTIRRSDGSGATLSRPIAEWLVSSAPSPNEADLDALFDGATRARVVDRVSIWGEPPPEPTNETVHADVADPNALAELRSALRLTDTGGHMMMTTCKALEISGPEGLRASLGVMMLSLVRWKGRWHTDAQLLNHWALGEWIAKYGSDVPLRLERERVAREDQAAEEDSRRQRDWESAMPAPLRAVWSRVMDEEARFMFRDDVDISEALSALESARGAGSLIDELFAWASVNRSGSSGWYVEEIIGMRIIRAFAADDEIVQCLAAQPAPTVIAGVRRFLRWEWGQVSGSPRTRAKRRRKAQLQELEQSLLAVCPALREGT